MKMNYEKKDLSQLVQLSSNQIDAIARVTGQIFYAGYLPVVGRYLSHGKTDQGWLRLSTQTEFYNELRQLKNEAGIKISMERYLSGNEVGKVIRLRIGTACSGPVLSYEPGRGWANLYSRGNYKTDYANGGNWASDHRRTYPTMREALLDRDYLVTGIDYHQKCPILSQEMFGKLWTIGN